MGSASLKKHNSLSQWLAQVDPVKRYELEDFCRKTHSIGALVAWLVKAGEAFPIEDCESWLREFQGEEARLFNQENEQYLGVSIIGALDRVLVELHEQLNLCNERLNYANAAACQDNPMGILTISQAMNLKRELLKDIGRTVNEIETSRRKQSNSLQIWQILAHARNVFMRHEPVYKSVHVEWLQAHWDFVLDRLSDDFKNMI